MATAAPEKDSSRETTPDDERNPRDPTLKWMEVMERLAEGADTATTFPSHGENEIVPFSGEPDSLTFVEFLNRFHLVTRGRHIKNATRCRIFPLYLTGRALDYYGTLDKETQKNYEILLTAFRTKFSDTSRSQTASIEIRSRQNLPSESLTQYRQAMTNLARLAFPSASYEEQNRAACLDFVVGLPRELGEKVMQARPKTLDNALALAIEITSMEELTRKAFAARHGIPLAPREKG